LDFQAGLMLNNAYFLQALSAMEDDSVYSGKNKKIGHCFAVHRPTTPFHKLTRLIDNSKRMP
jgi:hypothetical protein